MSTSLRSVTALIVGGGPVARVIGRALKSSGIDDIGLLIRPKYHAIADQGFELHQHQTMKKKRLRQRYDDFKIVPNVEALARVHYDQVYICVSGPELRTGWLEQAWPHLRHSTWIAFTPGVDDYEYIARTVPERYIVMAKVGFVAYDAPLPSEDINPPGIAYWYPPWQMTFIQGPDEALTTLIAGQLERGGLPCGVSSSFWGERLYDSALTTCAAAALEIHNWNPQALLADKTGIARLCVTQGEIGAAVFAKYGSESLVNRRFRKPFWWKMSLKYLDGFCPIPLFEYMQHHFSKHRRQMEQQFGDFVKLVKASGGQSTGTESLALDWARQRPQLAERSMDHLMPLGMVANTSVRSVYSETGQLGGELRGKAAADARGMPLGATEAYPVVAQPPVAQSHQQLPVRPGSRPDNPTQPVPQQGYNPHQPPPPQQGYPPQQPQGYPQQPQQPGYPQQPQQPGYPQQPQGYPPRHGYPPGGTDQE